MTNFTAFITTRRNDLFEITADLFRGIEDRFFATPEHPLLISTIGSGKSGKRIITLAAMDSLFDGKRSLECGRKGYDEYWAGTRNKTPFAVQYIDAARHLNSNDDDYVYGQSALNLRRISNRYAGGLEKAFLRISNDEDCPGLKIIQNGTYLEDQPRIEILIERAAFSPSAYPADYNRDYLRKVPQVSQAFTSMAKNNDWTRLVEITVTDSRLTTSPRFQDAFRQLCAKTDIPVYAQREPQVF